MKLYYTKGACSLASRIVINEIGVTCDFESVDLKAKRTESDQDYFKINPKGAVPALQISNNEVLTENAVIHQYLADTNKATELLPSVGDLRRYRVLEWLNYVATELHKNMGGFFNATIPQEIKEQYLTPVIKSKLKYVDQHLQDKKFLYDEKFTLPDAYLFVMINWAVQLKLGLNEFPNLSRYFSELQKRKSIQQSLQEEGLKTVMA